MCYRESPERAHIGNIQVMHAASMRCEALQQREVRGCARMVSAAGHDLRVGTRTHVKAIELRRDGASNVEGASEHFLCDGLGRAPQRGVVGLAFEPLQQAEEHAREKPAILKRRNDSALVTGCRRVLM